jgi:hypothetical protein
MSTLCYLPRCRSCANAARRLDASRIMSQGRGPRNPSLKPILQRFGLTLQGNETVGKGGQGTPARSGASPMLLSKIFRGVPTYIKQQARRPAPRSNSRFVTATVMYCRTGTVPLPLPHVTSSLYPIHLPYRNGSLTCSRSRNARTACAARPAHRKGSCEMVCRRRRRPPGEVQRGTAAPLTHGPAQLASL